jgi:hypothetical protein
MRPRLRKRRRAAVLVAALALVLGVWWYRPWEAHFKGRPTGYWEARLAALPRARYRFPTPLTPTQERLSQALTWLGIEWEPEFDELRLLDSEAGPVLIELLQSQNPHVRYFAAHLLGVIERRPKKAVPALVEAWQRYKGDVGELSEDRQEGYATAADAVDEIRRTVWMLDQKAAAEAGIVF